MADIDVVPKHRSNVWLWIVLAIIVLALIIWAIAGRAHTTAELRQVLSNLAQLHTTRFALPA